jgi:hypothetical protein
MKNHCSQAERSEAHTVTLMAGYLLAAELIDDSVLIDDKTLRTKAFAHNVLVTNTYAGND